MRPSRACSPLPGARRDYCLDSRAVPAQPRASCLGACGAEAN